MPDVLERWELHSTVSTTGRVEACWLGRWVRQRSSKGRSWARAPGVRFCGWGPHHGLSSLRSWPWLVRRMQGAGKALHELLLSAQRQGCLTAGVYESAKVLNV